METLEAYVSDCLYGDIQNPETFAIRASLYWKERYPSSPWGHWTEGRSQETYRTYNYPHVVNIYHALYRIGKLYGLTQNRTPKEYLTLAYNTAVKWFNTGPWCHVGVMCGSNVLNVLDDPAFGVIGCGAQVEQKKGRWMVIPMDGLRKRIMPVEENIDIEAVKGEIQTLFFSPDMHSLELKMGVSTAVKIRGLAPCTYELSYGGSSRELEISGTFTLEIPRSAAARIVLLNKSKPHVILKPAKPAEGSQAASISPIDSE